MSDNRGRNDAASSAASRSTSQSSTASENNAAGSIAYQKCKEVCSGRSPVPERIWFEDYHINKVDLMDAILDAAMWIMTESSTRGTELQQQWHRIAKRMHDNITEFRVPDRQASPWRHPLNFRDIYANYANLEGYVPNNDLRFLYLPRLQLSEGCWWILLHVKKIQNRDWSHT